MANVNIGFRVPVNMAHKISEENNVNIIEDWGYERGYIHYTCDEETFDVVVKPIIIRSKIAGFEDLWSEESKKNDVTDFENIVNELVDIQKAKNTDYGDSFSKNVQEYGLLAGLIPIKNKFHRLEHLITTGNQQVKSESIEDTLKDLACYSIMMLSEVRKKRLA